jgi:hypothetical protein
MSLGIYNKALVHNSERFRPWLPRLPVELVEHIASALEYKDLLSIRLVCKDLYHKSQHAFGHSFFTVVRTDLSQKGLQFLQDLAEEEQFRHHVKTLLIKPKSSELGLGRDLHWRKLQTESLDASSYAIGILQDILVQKLVNCRSFYIFCNQMDDTKINATDFITHSDAVGIILTIVAQAGLAIKSLVVGTLAARGVGKVSPKGIGTLPGVGAGWINAKKLQPGVFHQPNFRIAWDHLQELILSVHLQNEAFDWTYELVSRATNLQTLSLGFYHGLHTHFDVDAFTERLILSPQRTRLRDLRLSKTVVSEAQLVKFLLHFRESLSILSFGIVRVQDGRNSWSSIFSQLADGLPHLESIAVTYISEGREASTQRVIFPTIWHDPSVSGSDGRKFEPIFRRPYRNKLRLFGVRYQGPEIKAALNILAKSVEFI